MARRRTSVAKEPWEEIPVLPRYQSKVVFRQWMEREGVDNRVLAKELGITPSYVNILRSGKMTPGAALRIRIHKRTGGAVPFDCWEVDP